MIAKRIFGYNHIFGKPDSWTDEQKCHPLAVRAVDHPVFGKEFQSAWEPTPAELEILNAGGHVILTVVGGQPPVHLSAELNIDGNEI